MEFVNRQARIATDLISSLQSIKNDQPGVVKDRPVLNRRRHPHYSHDGQIFVTIHGEQNKDNFTRKENPNVQRLVYAILDSQSDTTFILQNTWKLLGLLGEPVKLKLSTMHAEKKVIDSSKVQGLMVRGFNSQQRIRDIMPANWSYILEVAGLWSHLEYIANLILPLQNYEAGLLIRYNCTKVLTPRDIITSDEPYGQQIDLGIVGLIDATWEDVDNDSVGISHHIVLKDVPKDLSVPSDSRPEHIIFSLRNRIKEIIDPNSLAKMFELDFSENYGKSKSLS